MNLHFMRIDENIMYYKDKVMTGTTCNKKTAHYLITRRNHIDKDDLYHMCYSPFTNA
jgi:hypothetical protein